MLDRDAKCSLCATLSRRLQITQCAEGWHRDDEPDTQLPAPLATEGGDDDTAGQDVRAGVMRSFSTPARLAICAAVMPSRTVVGSR